jgi:hypothetical protein
MVAGIGILGLTASHRRYVAFVIVCVVLYAAVFPLLKSDGPHLVILRNIHLLFPPFVIGMVAFQLRQQLPLRFTILVALGVVSGLSYGRPWFYELFVLAWSYGVLYFGFLKCKPLLAYNRLGDYSYGMYIYAFPVEQITAAVYKGMHTGSHDDFVNAIDAGISYYFLAFYWKVCACKKIDRGGMACTKFLKAWLVGDWEISGRLIQHGERKGFAMSVPMPLQRDIWARYPPVNDTRPMYRSSTTLTRTPAAPRININAAPW